MKKKIKIVSIIIIVILILLLITKLFINFQTSNEYKVNEEDNVTYGEQNAYFFSKAEILDR